MWPIGYARYDITIIQLERHLESTAYLAVQLFKNRFGALTKALTKEFVEEFIEKSNMEDIVFAVGLLHDLGKASLYYYENFIKHPGREVSFQGHEHVISCILEKIATDKQDKLFKAQCDLIAKIISRHHSAMEKRHPIKFDPPGYFSEAISEMCNEKVTGFIKEKLIPISKKHGYDFTRKVLESLLGYLQNKEFCKEITWFKYSRSIQSFQLSGLGIDSSDKRIYDVYKITSILTGILIIADNLVATWERRNTDDKAGPLYVRYWQRELKYKLDSFLARVW